MLSLKTRDIEHGGLENFTLSGEVYFVAKNLLAITPKLLADWVSYFFFFKLRVCNLDVYICLYYE
jgi:hypothetical protein